MTESNTLCVMLGQRLRLWMKMNPALVYRSYCVCNPSQPDTLTQCWFNVSPSSVMQAQHRVNIGFVYVYPWVAL